jgi:hypothetical protein
MSQFSSSMNDKTMALRSKSLKGQGQLTGPGLECAALYELTHKCKDDSGFKSGSITGRVTVAGLHPPPGHIMVLKLEDGRKLKILTEFDGIVTAIGEFF